MRNIKTESILWFMKSKGWKEEEKGSFYHIMIPPKEDQGFEEGARFYVPRKEAEGSDAYLQSVEGLLDSLSYLYDIDVPDLVMMFSAPVEQWKNNIHHLQSMISAASS